MCACLVCHKSKIEHQKPSGMMQPLFVPEWKWDSISMDFVGVFPKTMKVINFIWVVVNRLTKSAHFIPIKTGMLEQNVFNIVTDDSSHYVIFSVIFMMF